MTAVCLCAGDAAVGKSALSQMFSSDGAHFHKNYSMVRYANEIWVKVSLSVNHMHYLNC